MKVKNLTACLIFSLSLAGCATSHYTGGAPEEISSDADFEKQVSVVSWFTSAKAEWGDTQGDVIHPRQAIKESREQALSECRAKGFEDPQYLRGSCYLEAKGQYYCTEVFQCDAANSDMKNKSTAALKSILAI